VIDPAERHVDVEALVLGHVDAPARATMAAHLLACPACRADYDHLSVVVSELLPSVPPVQPPLGFDQRALTHMGIDRPVATRTATRWWLAGAAAALVVLASAVGLWRSTSGDPSPTAGDVSSLQRVRGGDAVGTVSISEIEDRTVMVVALVGAPDGVAYRCRTTFADGTTSDTEPWPAGNGAWVVPLPDSQDGQVTTVELVVDGTDDVWSIATF
jgi:anti-sigma factor RsiW